jgi:hypothetical protein
VRASPSSSMVASGTAAPNMAFRGRATLIGGGRSCSVMRNASPQRCCTRRSRLASHTPRAFHDEHTAYPAKPTPATPLQVVRPGGGARGRAGLVARRCGLAQLRVRVWEHEDPSVAASHISEAMAPRQ